MINYSPLRYPGGKSALYPIIASAIKTNGLKNCTYVEPFAGGASIALSLLVDGVVDAEGNFIQNPRRYSLRKVTDEIVSRQIGEMMLEVTRTGTGQGVRLEGAEAAGKTSSAETGWAVGDETMVHGWFVGYFPYHAPRYAMAVFVENGRQGARACVPVFDEIAEKILQNHW